MCNNHLKRIVSIVLCIACLIPAMTSFAAQICPQCGGRVNPGRERTTYQTIDDNSHYVIVKRTYKCSGRCGMSFERQISKTSKGHSGEWVPDGTIEKRRCPGCNHISTRPRSITIRDAFGDAPLKAPMSDSDYVSNMKNAIRSWALQNNKTGLATITSLDGGPRNFGSSTEEAVRLFQELYGLDKDGIVGDDTKRVLLPYCNMVK